MQSECLTTQWKQQRMIFYHSTLSVYMCCYLKHSFSQAVCQLCGNANRCHQKSHNSKCSFIKAHKRCSLSLGSISEETNNVVLLSQVCPNRNPLTGSSEVLFSLPILLSGAGRGPLHIKPRPDRLRDQCEESRHCQRITSSISSDIQWNTQLCAIREWNMCASMCHVLRLRGSDESRTKCRDAVP